MIQTPILALLLALSGQPAASSPARPASKPVQSATKPAQPAMPQVTFGEASGLIWMARAAMNDYLVSRTPADRQAIPSALQHLSEKSYGAAITLRKDGISVAQRISYDADLPRNVLRAALSAMRSSDQRLGEVVTKEVLDGLVIELEVLGPFEPVPLKDLAAAAEPGLTGFRATRGLDDTFALPSVICSQDMGPQAIARLCLSQMPNKPEAASLPIQWAAFVSRHYVGTPDGKVVWLYRGKSLLPEGSIDPKTLAGAAEQIGAFLMRTQDKTGRLLPGDTSAGLIEHLYATYAMARLARASGRPELAPCVNAALGFAASFVHQPKGLTLAGSDEGDDQIAATSLLSMALGELPADPRATSLRLKLLAGLKGAIADGKLLSRADGASTRPASLSDWSLAALAMEAAAAAPGADPNFLAAPPRPRSAIFGADGRVACWQIRAGFADGVEPMAAPLPIADDAPLDCQGGFAAQGEQPSTVVAALAAVNLSMGKTWPRLPMPADANLASRQMQAYSLDAKRFCYQMMYKPREMYFVTEAEADAAIGGVRAGPQSARVSLEACAAAIEAFLSK